VKKHFILALIALVFAVSHVTAQKPSHTRPVVVGILVFDKAYITEFAGPLDVYHHVAPEKLKVFVISGTKKDLTSYEGLAFRTDYTIANAPKVDVLVVPSGAGSLGEDAKNKVALAWIRKTSADAKFVTSHCEGAFLLAEAGLLAGKTATTFHTDVGTLQKRYPACRVQGGKRVVVDGNLVTSAGGLASYEGALYVVGRLFGEDEARAVGKALAFDNANVANALGSSSTVK